MLIKKCVTNMIVLNIIFLCLREDTVLHLKLMRYQLMSF